MERLEAWHLVFDGVLADRPTAVQLRQLLEALVAEIGLQTICPLAVWVSSPSWAAFVMIAESHVSAHGEDRLGWVDVFSCRSFGEAAVKAVIERHLRGSWQAEWVRRPAVA